jgi:hypothetical protein
MSDTKAKIDKSSYRQQEVKILGGETKRVLFIDTKPNSCFIFNRGLGDIYVSRKTNVTTSSYELLIAGNSLQSFVKVLEFSEIYIYSESDTSVIVESFTTENLAPADIPETQQIVFTNTSPITLGNINSIINPVTVKDVSSIVTLLNDIKLQNDTMISLLTDIKTNTTPVTP